MEKQNYLLHSQEEAGCNRSSLGTPKVTAERLEVILKTRGDTYILPEIFNILFPRRCKQHPGLRTLVVSNIQ